MFSPMVKTAVRYRDGLTMGPVLGRAGLGVVGGAVRQACYQLRNGCHFGVLTQEETDKDAVGAQNGWLLRCEGRAR